MGVDNIRIREKELVNAAFAGMDRIAGLHLLADQNRDRLGIISFYLENAHFNLVVKLLNDKFGIQVRGGCACAGTYGHYLLDVSYEKSHQITNLINSGDLSQKPGWIRLSLHPTMTGAELDYILDGIRQVALNHKKWESDYVYNRKTNEFRHMAEPVDKTVSVKTWFEF
jgi:selenocysteine lyase/cysteine desulfurase